MSVTLELHDVDDPFSPTPYSGPVSSISASTPASNSLNQLQQVVSSGPGESFSVSAVSPAPHNNIIKMRSDPSATLEFDLNEDPRWVASENNEVHDALKALFPSVGSNEENDRSKKFGSSRNSATNQISEKLDRGSSASKRTDRLKNELSIIKKQCDQKDGLIARQETDISNLKEKIVKESREQRVAPADSRADQYDSNGLQYGSFKADELRRLEKILDQQYIELDKVKNELCSKDEEISMLKQWMGENQYIGERDAKNQEERWHAQMKGLMKLCDSKHQEILSNYLSRQSKTLMNMAQHHFEFGKAEVDKLQFELKKKESLVKTLQSDLQERINEIWKLKNDLTEQGEELKRAQISESLATSQYQANAESVVALNSAELNSLRRDMTNLLEQFRVNEIALSNKDDEIRKLRRILTDREAAISAIQRKLNSLQLDLDMKDLALEELEQSKIKREDELSRRLLLQKEEHSKQLQKEKDSIDALTQNEELIVSSLQNDLLHLKEEISMLSVEVERKATIIEENYKYIKDLEDQVVDLDTKIASSDQSYQLQMMKKTEQDLKDKIQIQMSRIEALQHDSIILQKIRSENVSLQRKIAELEGQAQRYEKFRKEMDFRSSATSNGERVQRQNVDLQIQSSSTSSCVVKPKGNMVGRLSSNNVTKPISLTRNEEKHSDGISESEALIDKSLSDYLKHLRHSLPFKIVKKDGYYFFGNRRVFLKFVNGEVLASVGDYLMKLDDLIAAERHAQSQQAFG